MSQLILQPFHRVTHVTAILQANDINLTPILPSLYLRHNSFSNPSVASPTSQFFLQPFFRFSYVTGSSLMLRGEPQCDVKPNYNNSSNNKTQYQYPLFTGMRIT